MSAPIKVDTGATHWFGSFTAPCKSVPLPLCPLVGLPAGQGSTPAECYTRNTEFGGRIVLLPSSIAAYLLIFIMTAIMIFHVKSKYTSVGRKEMVIFFYLYLLTHFVELLLATGAIRASSPIYAHAAAFHIGLISATFWCLFVNGLVSFQIIEDGTRKSVWLVRLSSAVICAVGYVVAIDTFNGTFHIFNRASPSGLWVFYFFLNGAFLAIYIVLQIVLVVHTLDSRWPVGDILIGVAFFAISYACLFLFGGSICRFTDHYVDGIVFGTLFNLLAVLMVYKYWDSITTEDLEFAVGGAGGTWEVRENLLPYSATPGPDNMNHRLSASYAPSYVSDYGSEVAFATQPTAMENSPADPAALGVSPPAMSFSFRNQHRHPSVSASPQFGFLADGPLDQPPVGARSPQFGYPVDGSLGVPRVDHGGSTSPQFGYPVEVTAVQPMMGQVVTERPQYAFHADGAPNQALLSRVVSPSPQHGFPVDGASQPYGVPAEQQYQRYPSPY